MRPAKRISSDGSRRRESAARGRYSAATITIAHDRRALITRQHGVAFLVALLASLLTTSASAQQPNDDVSSWAAATLPENNEALLLSSRAQDAIAAGDYRLAIELIDRIYSLPGGLVAAPATSTFYPLPRQAARLLARLPQEGVELFRQLYDAEVAARLTEASKHGDRKELEELFRRRRLSSLWPAVATELAALLVDQGRFAEAIEVIREARLSIEPGKDATLRTLEVIALAGAGAGGAAKAALNKLRQADPQGAVSQRVAAIESWAAIARQREGALDPLLGAGPVWQQSLSNPGGATLLPDSGEISDAVSDTRRLPLIEPTLGDGALVVRAAGYILCFDALTLSPRWSERESGPPGDTTGTLDGAHLGAGDGVVALLQNHLRHVCSIGQGRVYSIEGLGADEPQIESFGWRPNSGVSAPVRRNEIVARDLRTGAVQWRTSDDLESPLFDVAFQDRPLLVGGRLAALFRRADDLLLAFLDPASGRLIREMPIVGPPTYFTSEGGRSLLSADETTLYILTGSGVVAAVGALDGEWKWATVYQSNLAERLGRLPWQAMDPPSEWNVERALLADDLLILAPIDSPTIFALDRFTGAERWRLPRGEHSFVVGAVEDGLVLGGRRLACFDLARPDQGPPRWQSASLDVTGRPVCRSNRVYVPTAEGVAVLDGRTGKLTADQAFPVVTDSAAPANPLDRAPLSVSLMVSSTGLYAFSADRVIFYPDPARAASEFGEQSEPEERGPAEYGLAWLAALGGRLDEAAERLDALSNEESKIPDAALRALRRHIWMGRAAAATGSDRVECLRRAAELTTSPAETARLALEIGAALESDGQREEALKHYIGLLSDRATLPVDASDRQVHASWLAAVGRIRTLVNALPAETIAAIVEQHAHPAKTAEETAVLERLCIALRDRPESEAIRRALVASDLPPELAIHYLPNDWRPGAAPGDRELLLRRWEAHVSLNMLEQGEKDREMWNALAGASPAPASQSAEEAERIAGIEKAERKLRRAPTDVFDADLGLRWKIEDAELLADVDRPALWLRPWLMIREHQNRQIQMIAAHQPDFPWRKTPDELSHSGISLAELDRQLFGRPGVDDGRLGEGWPMVTYDNLAAIPVIGGMICAGLGPERHAGNFLWDFPIPAWDHIPARFANRSASGPLGVYCAPRSDRVALIGWTDGQVWWRRDFPGYTIERMQLFGDTLFVISEDCQVWALDALTGADRGMNLDDYAARRAALLVGGTLLLWGDDFIAGADAKSLKPLWRRDISAIERVFPVAEQNWLAWKQRGGRDWRLLDARNGEVVGPPSIGQYDRVNAIALVADRLFVAGQSELGEGDDAGQTTVSCFGANEEKPLWQAALPTRVRVNLTQLIGHPEFVPMLVARASRGGAYEGADLPALVLVRKSDGQLLPPRSIKSDYKVADAACDLCVLTTPTRVIVQASKTLLGYGSASKAGAP